MDNNDNSVEEYIYPDDGQQGSHRSAPHDRPYVTILLIAVNVLVFLCVNVRYSDSSANLLIEHGGAYPPYIKENGEYYRLFTSMFLHSGFEHLLNNMICLAVFGNIIEKFWGRWRFLILYILGGLTSSVVEYSYNLSHDENVVSIGASGAVYALVAGLVILAIMNEDMRKMFNPLRLFIVALFAIADGFFSMDNIGNAAHIGGFVAGVVITYILELVSHMLKKMRAR
jgi:rhomboid protease GluP